MPVQSRYPDFQRHMSLFYFCVYLLFVMLILFKLSVRDVGKDMALEGPMGILCPQPHAHFELIQIACLFREGNMTLSM